MLEEVRSATRASHPRSPEATLLGTRLAASPFLSSEERHALESITLPPRSIAAYKDLLRQCEPAHHVEILIEGWACRYKTTREGHRQIVALLIPGDVANLDTSLFTRSNYSARTLTAAKTISVARDRISSLAEQHIGIAKTRAWLAMRENAILSQWALCLGRLSARQRLAHLLCELSVRLGNAVETESRFELPLTQEQIADMLGLTAVHVNRMVQQLRAGGLIDTHGRAMTITDMAALRRIGEFDPAYLHDQRA